MPDDGKASTVSYDNSSRQNSSRPGASDWQAILREAVTAPEELCRLLQLPSHVAEEAVVAADAFPMCVPQPFLARMKPGDPADPLLRQVLPIRDEVASQEGFTEDPLGEQPLASSNGVLQKYQRRLLILSADACAVHCRFCFRRHFAVPIGPAASREIVNAWLAEINRDPTINEVILSGGDPLMLDDAQLLDCLQKIAQVSHVQRVRVHTRMPIVIPQRVTEALAAHLSNLAMPVYFVLHCNHARELDADVRSAIRRLRASGATLLAQTVLLRGVNDDIQSLLELFQTLVNEQVMPYYLHQLDRVAGAAHFEVPVERGQMLVQELRDRLPGYAVPKYVRETPGGTCKSPLG